MIREEFLRLAAAGYNRIPLACETLADFDTPLSIYLKLADRAQLLPARVGAGRREVGPLFDHRPAVPHRAAGA